jgi:hypothetical protein
MESVSKVRRAGLLRKGFSAGLARDLPKAGLRRSGVGLGVVGWLVIATLTTDSRTVKLDTLFFVGSFMKRAWV